jgi:hypothetical protein
MKGQSMLSEWLLFSWETDECRKLLMRESGIIAASLALLAATQQAMALEGGTGAYLLGSRDSMAGFVPPPGTYITNSSVFMNADAPTLSISGVPVTAPETDVYINKTDISHFFEGQVFGGTAGVTVSIPVVTGELSGSFLPNAPFQGFKDQDTGFGDLTITPVIGWHDGNLHYNFALSIFMPTGEYDSAEISLAPPSVNNILNFSKNKWMFMPTLSATYLDPQVGLEFSGALGIGFSTRNPATDWKNAPELTFEGAILQHFPNRLAFGVSGYYFQQLGEDSGSGADNFKSLVGAESLQARLFGIGPILTYQTAVGNIPVSLEAKYTHEFGARRRFEGDLFWGSINFAF